uniref:Uncharacterized protein n=1 Tax=Canis lupus familiaris TaxID=9615 RepID=A0A8C0TI36_CANLF
MRQSQLTFRELSVFILRWPIWGCGIFILVIKFGMVLLVHFGFTRASVITASMSKQRKLPTYWFVPVGNKRDSWFQIQV